AIFAIFCTRKENEKNKRLLFFSIVMVLAQIGIAVAFGSLYEENAIIFTLKRLLLLAVLWAVAYTDFREHKISNKVLLIGLLGWVILTVAEAITDKAIFRESLIRECSYAGIILILLVFVRFVSKGGIGMGDIKLLTLMALLEGSDGFMESILLSCIVIFIIAVILLIVRKKGRKDQLPFAPAVLIGTYISMFLVGA
ncbi:MAG: prepilin peptidase, partial [Lachnospiraceae bacterium]|nr:prepilin peptidase [Lachnospiraceae bacterium]